MRDSIPPLVRPTATPWKQPAQYWSSLAAATAHLETPLGVIDHQALAHNAYDMIDRAHGTPIRVASKSVRVRAVLDAVLALPGFSGVLAYTLAEGIWLAGRIDDVVIGYPTADRGALRVLGSSDELASRVTLMVDSVDHLDFIDSVLPPRERATIRVAIELDASFRSHTLGRLGVWRSPVHDPDDARVLARAIAGRAGFVLVGMMAYESQIAGLQNRVRGAALRSSVIRSMQERSFAELLERRGAAVEAVRAVAPLEFVNGGGTGSLHLTSTDPSVTEIGAGSGLLAGHTFDSFADFEPAPASAWALDVVRRPSVDRVTVLGGGWIASGPPGPDRLPRVVWPEGLEYARHEQAGEVQTPLAGPAARSMALGDRVWFRHAKSGELGEHLTEFGIVDDGVVVATVPTYRGERKMFL
ncbi:amino acid deaminase/aldolase [Herbiconiux sp. L3-i23]|uniref:amino acid deaminase/aldolase n=1 Tax=Herbiconiux sp. L3-i23 TaxID=2905871 RepID=UPI002062CD81|nr:amino acid deaminase/aldolase [Herbiconiux sp. L3-i23]BDI23585.1 alanine racemase [Herbiconiux sp. L3-i23]